MIQLSNISLHFGDRSLFKAVDYQVNPSDKIGLVGKNGAGKSTLLKLISGAMRPDNGQVSYPNGTKIGYLTQDIDGNLGVTVRDYVSAGQGEISNLESRIEEIGNILANDPDPSPDLYDELADLHTRLAMVDGGSLQEEVSRVLNGLGFQESEMDNTLDTFSGGWQMRAVLAKLLIDKPDVLLLDEPTNHLDIHSIFWLEKYLKSYQGAMILISHDRRFLDSTIDKIVEVMNGRLTEYKCVYSKYLIKREELVEQNQREYENQQKYIEKTEQLINKFRAKKNKAVFAQSLIKKLDKMEKVELAETDDSRIALRFPAPERSGKVVLKCADIAKSYGEKSVIKSSSFEIERGDKRCLVGGNGSGKSTLIRMITGEEKYQGDIDLGHNVKLGYFAQDSQDDLDRNKTVFEIIDDIAVGDVRKKVRTILGSFLFSGEDTEKKVSVLSGGEKTRLALCKLMLEPYNFLILDEPTNHLDIRSKEILQQALKAFEGTVLVVSHDREFVGGLTDKLLHVDNGHVKPFYYGVDEYLDKHGNQDLGPAKSKPAEVKPSNSELDYKERKRIKNRIAKLERDIAKLEKEASELKEKVNDLDAEQQQQAFERFKQIDDETLQMMSEWEDLSEKASDF